MSMISSQVGELRFMAHMLDTDGHPSFAREVRRAADTIWELRNKLAGTVDQSEEIERLKCENAELREMLSESRQANEKMFTELKRYKSVFRRRPYAMNALFDENAKLRELIRTVWLAGDFRAFLGVDEIKECMRELGIEVEDDD